MSSPRTAGRPLVYRIPAGSDTLERFIESPLLLSAQGLALTPDERTLFVADYARGILRVDLARRSVTLMQTADSVLALGIDGLYYQGGQLIGIQNGVDAAPGGPTHPLARGGSDRARHGCSSGRTRGTRSRPWACW